MDITTTATDPMPAIPDDEFHMGLTMAGAASAGCYTAGTMDYLFEILDLWQKAKEGKLPDGWDKSLLQFIPKHKVIIDAMGGTSAGGMTTVMSAIYALKGVASPVSDPANKMQQKNNVMYDSWVLMGDEESGTKILEKTFSTSDLDQSGKIKSLLNSDFIDAICDNAFTDDGKPKNKFPFIADNLELVLSHTMLRSIPLAVDFTTPGWQQRRTKKSPEHCSFEHFTISHFKLDYDEARDKDKYLPLKPFDQRAAKAMKLATMATGAFPVGLKFREFFGDELTSAYIKHVTRDIAFNRLSDIPSADVPEIDWPEDFPNPFQFVSIDGGAINNEPFGEVLGILKSRYGKKKPADNYHYAVVMIDPFPDVMPEGKYIQPDDLFSVVPAIIGTLWDQSKVKRAEMLDAYSSEYYRGEIFPLRWKKQSVDEHHPIACGAAMAFGGFLDIDFRHHDFFLGRDNARNFFRTYFTLEYNEAKGIIHPIHKDWPAEMRELFKMPGKDGSIYLPIIPDLYFLKQKKENTYEGPFQRTIKEWPQYDASKLFALKDKMKSRFEKMLELSYKKITEKQDPGRNPVTTSWIDKYYGSKSWLRWFRQLSSWIGGGVIRLLFNMNKGKIANRITKAAIEWILKDLEEMKLLKK